MNKKFSLLLILLLIPLVSANCCVIKDTACTFWDMGNWSSSSDFCSRLNTFFGLNTTFYSIDCTSLTSNITGCADGFSTVLCGDGKCQFPEACSSCQADCGVCPSSGGGGGGGGGGGCTSDWKCSDWSSCTDNKQTRTCENQNSCQSNQPELEKSCKSQPSVTNPINENETQVISSAQDVSESQTQTSKPGITGAVIGNVGKTIGSPVGITITLILVLGTAFFLLFKPKFFSKKN